jgi:type IV secretion system protein VirB9
MWQAWKAGVDGGARKRRTRALALMLALLTTTAPAMGQSVNPRRSAGDPRLREVVYRDDQVVLLRGYIGYQMMLEFDRAEKIENVAIGDANGWQVTPNRAATLLFLKPIALGAQTNMTVVTNLRSYAFELVTRPSVQSDDPRIMYHVRFIYPAPAAAPVAAPPRDPATLAANSAYRLSGSRRIGLTRVFDTGAATYFQFAADADTPAIFMLGPDNKEELVNAQQRGGYFVVDQIARGFVLRRGAERTVVRNRAFKEPTNAADRRGDMR